MITIKIHEENNKLYLESPFDSIVCGNTNYDVEFMFSKDWEERPTKTALIIAAGRKSSVEFTGNTFHLPPIPNCSTFMILIYANDQYSPGLVTSSIELDAIPTASVGELPEFEDINSYAFEILKRLDNFEDGTTKAKYAEVADVATNIANPNLLINGNFTINQSGKKTNYASENNTYIIDRWLGTEGMGIYFFNPMYIQKDEDYEIGYLKQIIDYIDILADKELCLSIKGRLDEADSDYFVSMPVKFSSSAPEEDTIIASKQVFEGLTLEFVHLASGYVCVQLKVETAIDIPIDYIKLEYGSVPTALCPTTYAEELLKCQRYCYLIQLQRQDYFFTGTSDGNNYLFFRVTLPCLLRTTPTITSTATFMIDDPLIQKMKEVTFLNYSNYYVTCHIKGTEKFTTGHNYLIRAQYAGSFRVDAEIYP